MRRPRWHDLAMVAAILGVLVVGVWALWWDDLRSALGIEADPPAEVIERPSPT